MEFLCSLLRRRFAKAQVATSRNVNRLEDLETKRFTLLANGTAIVCVCSRHFAPLDYVVSHAAVINGRHAMLLLEEERCVTSTANGCVGDYIAHLRFFAIIPQCKFE